MAELTGQAAAELVKELNKELFWTGWYAVNSSNNIQWTIASRDTMNNGKKEQIEQEKT